MYEDGNRRRFRPQSRRPERYDTGIKFFSGPIHFLFGKSPFRTDNNQHAIPFPDRFKYRRRITVRIGPFMAEKNPVIAGGNPGQSVPANRISDTWQPGSLRLFQGRNRHTTGPILFKKAFGPFALQRLDFPNPEFHGFLNQPFHPVFIRKEADGKANIRSRVFLFQDGFPYPYRKTSPITLQKCPESPSSGSVEQLNGVAGTQPQGARMPGFVGIEGDKLPRIDTGGEKECGNIGRKCLHAT